MPKKTQDFVVVGIERNQWGFRKVLLRGHTTQKNFVVSYRRGAPHAGQVDEVYYTLTDMLTTVEKVYAIRYKKSNETKFGDFIPIALGED